MYVCMYYTLTFTLVLQQEKALTTASEEAIPAKCGYFEKFLVTNSKHGFFIGDKVSKCYMKL